MNQPAEKPAVIVTGGGRGLGSVIAKKLAEDFNVLIVGRTEKDLKDVCDQIKVSGNTAAYVVGDVSVSSTAEESLAKIDELGWNLTALVCNAGIGKSRVTHEISSEEWQTVLNTNVNGSFYFSRMVLPRFIEKKNGSLCFISSIAGVRGYAHEAAYVSSKHAIVGLAKSIALEYGKYGISSVALCPSFIEGDMTDRTIHGLAERRGISTGEAREVIEKKNPQRRIIPPEEIAEMVAFICKNKVPSLNGSAVLLTGGES
ncbi:N/A [soil metagenome]